MKIHDNPIAVCSWSLRTKDSAELIARVRSLELSHVQIALSGLAKLEKDARRREIELLLNSGLSFTGGMASFSGENYATIEKIRQTGGFVPDALWPQRRQQLADALEIAKELRLTAITTHVGFVPPPKEKGHDVMVQRVRDAAAMLAEAGIQLLMETGQESADELAEFIEEVARPTVGINFDPANMILYGAGDPIAAIEILARWIRHVHVKDATASIAPGTVWGAEVPFGAGQVGPRRFVAALREIHYAGPLAVEREAGDQRDPDVRAAIEALQQADS